ncbi:MAG: hypothetical protein ACI4OY_08835 [Aristaeellaceae bacterium]
MKRTALWVSVLCMVMMLALRGQAEGCLTVGDSVVFGHLEQDDDAANGSEPLTWTVLHTEDDKALLITAEVIASRQFHNRWLDTTSLMALSSAMTISPMRWLGISPSMAA